MEEDVKQSANTEEMFLNNAHEIIMRKNQIDSHCATP